MRMEDPKRLDRDKAHGFYSCFIGQTVRRLGTGFVWVPGRRGELCVYIGIGLLCYKNCNRFYHCIYVVGHIVFN